MVNLLKKTFLYTIWLYFRLKIENNKIEKKWIAEGKQLPPPHIVKFNTIKKFLKKRKANILIETGTFKGAMIDSCIKLFNKIYSIELDTKLHSEAQIKYKNNKNINLIQGDSAVELKKLLSDINERCLFWLDGHYSGGITAKGSLDTPIIEELTAIFKHKISDHIILIDDARLFIGEQDYPTLEELNNFVKNNSQYAFVSVENDIIIIC